MTSGPLAGVRVIEMAGQGPVPFAGMLLADMGADVALITRPGAADTADRVTMRGRRIVPLDLGDPEAREVALDLIASADVLMEGFRPGTMERIGLGPDVGLSRNPGLVYARMTGWGQDGPLSDAAGHDINYIAVAGALGAIGRQGSPPSIPLNLVGDFAGGSLYLLYGITCALIERSRSGRGQVVDAAMVDGVVNLLSMFHWASSRGEYDDVRGTHRLDSGAFFYDVYETADGEYMAVGCIEPKFYRSFCAALGLTGPYWERAQSDVAGWSERRQELAEIFRARTREEWITVFETVDACVTPVLRLSEVPHNRHVQERRIFVRTDRGLVARAAPRLSRTPGTTQTAARGGLKELLADWGLAAPRDASV